jgi:hypothetical protein
MEKKCAPMMKKLGICFVNSYLYKIEGTYYEFDYFCKEHGLVIELNGSIHDEVTQFINKCRKKIRDKCIHRTNRKRKVCKDNGLMLVEIWGKRRYYKKDDSCLKITLDKFLHLINFSKQTKIPLVAIIRRYFTLFQITKPMYYGDGNF